MGNARLRGFTLVELVVVIVLVGILAVTALPRLFDQSVFESRGFRDETLSLLRYAQKAAVVQRRTVCVALGATGVTLTIASAADSAVCNTSLTLPNANPRGGTGLAATDTASNPVGGFRFTPEGGTSLATDLTVTIAGSSGPITVDRITGHVY